MRSIVRSPRRWAAGAAWLSALVMLMASGFEPVGASGARPETRPTRTVVVLGDSLAVSPSAREGFPSVLQAKIEEEDLPWRVVNEGIRGDTTAGGLRRLDAVLAKKPDLLVVALGANDGLRGVDVATVSRNLDEIITRAQQQSARVLLCGMETPPLRGWEYTAAFHKIYPELAQRHNVSLVPFLLAKVALNRAMNGDDMIHPNAAGARMIASTVWPYLEPLLTAPRVTITRLR